MGEFEKKHEEQHETVEEIVPQVNPPRKKIKMRSAVVVKSISAPYLTNISKGETVKIPLELYQYYLDKGIVAPKKRTKRK